MEDANGRCEYKLYSVINHIGHNEGGHYTAFCKEHVSGQWYCFDDSKVTQIDPSHMSKKDAYILFYEKFELQQSDPNLGVENERKDHVEEPCTIHPTEKDLTRKRERLPSQKVRDNMSTNASKLCEEKISSETSDLSTKQSKCPRPLPKKTDRPTLLKIANVTLTLH